MITIMNKSLNKMEKCLDSQLWHACAGGMVQMPTLNSKVFYFPQGHTEHANKNIDFRSFPAVPHIVLCRVSGIRFLADENTDEVYAKMRLVPLKNESGIDNYGEIFDQTENENLKPTSFAKTLTQSDANNGGGFSVPRYCAETIFPRLDYSADPPVQTLVAKDVHGVKWKFRHIYRGTPRRHLLTTGWSNFVNQKKLVAGDSIVFLRAEDGDLCVGIRRAKRGFCGGSELSSGWNPIGGSSYGYSPFLREDGKGEIRNPHREGRLKAESVVEAVLSATKGEPFEAVYYPRASAPEFCVKAASVYSAMKIQWCPGMRFKMPFETEDSSRISWFMGTISGVQVEDPVQWPNSPWRVLLVSWDEPDLLQNVKRVSPWLVELVSSIPSFPIPTLSPPRKKMRIPHPTDFPFIGNHFPMAPFPSNNLLRPNSSPLCCILDSFTSPAGIQGARHARFGLPDRHVSKLPNLKDIEDMSSFLTIGIADQNLNKNNIKSQKPKFLLFGQPILTHDQICQSKYENSAVNKQSEGIFEKIQNLSDGSGSTVVQNGPLENSLDDGKSNFGLETVSS